MPVKKIPKLFHHRGNNQGCVKLNGRFVYLGPWGAPETNRAYNRTIAEWLANGHDFPEVDNVGELCLAYWHHAQKEYNGTGELYRINAAMRAVFNLYRDVPAEQFGPNALRAVRQTFIEKGNARKTINDYVRTIRRAFRWAAANELIPATIPQALATLEPISRRRGQVKETEPVKPVPTPHIDALEPYVSRQVWALVHLQLLTGARPGELVGLAPRDLNTTGHIWEAHPKHKTQHLGKSRTLYFGPKAQVILRNFFDRDLAVPFFSPREAEAERAAKADIHRRPNQKPNPRKTSRTLGEHYTTASYRSAIERACKAADVPKWTPHRLRHNAATAIRRQYGIEAAQTILGHEKLSSFEVTEIYAEPDILRAKKIIAEIG